MIFSSCVAKMNDLVMSTYRVMKTKLPLTLQSMTLYLANKDTEFILFKPVRVREQHNLTEIFQLWATNMHASGHHFILIYFDFIVLFLIFCNLCVVVLTFTMHFFCAAEQELLL